MKTHVDYGKSRGNYKFRSIFSFLTTFKSNCKIHPFLVCADL